MDNLQANPAENQEIWTPAMAERRSTPSPSIPGNRSLFLGDGAPSIGCQNLAAGSSPITGPNLLSGCSRSMMSATHEGSASAPRAALQGSCNLPAGCTKVPISIFVFQRRRAGRGSRPPTPLSGTSIPAPALPGVPGDSEDAPSILLPRSDFLSIGRASNDVASDMAMNPSAQATPVSCSSEHPSIHFQPNGLDAESPKTGIQGNDSQPSSSSAVVTSGVHSKLESAIPARTDETQGQHTKQLIELLGEGVTDHNMLVYQRTPKKPRTQLKQNDPTVVATPAALKERTLTQIDIQISGTAKVETFQIEDTPARKVKPRRKKHRAKVIREDKRGKKQNSAVTTPEEKSPNQKARRSYVRKKRNLSSLEKCPGPVTDRSISGGTENAARSRIASVRRRLQFELGEQGVQGDQSSTGNSCQHNEKLAHAKSSLCSMTRSAVQIGHGLQANMENLPGGLAFGMTRKLNELLDEYIHLPEITPKPTQEISPATSGCLSREVTGKQDNAGSTHDPDATRMGVTIMEGNNKDLGVKYSNIDGFDMHRLATSIPETESTESQVTKVSKLEEKEHGQHTESDSSLTNSRDSIILRAATEMLAFCQAGGIKKKRSIRARRISFVPIMDIEKNKSQAFARLPQSCMEALYESSCIKFATKKRSQKERLHSPSSIQPNMDKKSMFSSRSIFSGGSNGLKGSEGTFQQTLPQAPDNRRINLDIYCEVPERSSEHTYMDHLQGVTSRLKYLDLNTEHLHRTEMLPSQTMSAVVSFGETGGLSNSLVPYSGQMIFPYERPLHLVKKQRPRAKVNLDYETTRVWNLLMGKATEPVDGTDVDKERWWQQEREVFQGRANSFIARMRLVQGDRHFSPWKGSVVDSVVGVFLTQNVSDHLSSSAFMALAASFPPGSVHSNCEDDITSQANEEIFSMSAVGGDISMFDFFDSGTRSDLEATEGFCIHQETEIDHRAHQFPDFSSIELTASAGSPPEIQSQKDMSSTESVMISETITETQLSSSSGKNYAPRYFVGGVNGAAFQQLGSNFDGNPLAGNDAATNELGCQRIIGAINDNGVGEHVIPSPSVLMYPFISVDNRQPDVANEPYVYSTSHKSSAGSASSHPKNGAVEKELPLFMPSDNHIAQINYSKTVISTLTTPETSTDLPVKLRYNKRAGFEASELQQHESHSVTGGNGMIADTASGADESTLKSGFIAHNGVPDKAAQASRPKKARTTNKKNMEKFDWDKFRRQACDDGHMNERTFERRDSVDWEAVRCADVQRISHAIRERGMNNVLAERIQSFLNRLVRDHGSIDLEWLRDIPPDSAKDYLLSIRGLGLKSVECVRLLTLHHLAFPVDTNVGRICVRLGWVPIQPLPESLQLHLLELYPVLETIQKYIWPRLCKLDQQTLYELHYQMITFGKVFCTKSKPNCNACPMRSECKHFASAFASARLALPAPQEKSLVKSSNQFSFENSGLPTRNHAWNSTVLSVLPQLEGSTYGRDVLATYSEPIVEEPASPREEECPETLENDIEDYDADNGEIPTIKLNMEAFAQNLENCIKESNKDLQSDDIAKALVAISTEAASIPVPKLKNVRRLRTEHYVYELPDSHSLVQQLELARREPDDPSPYLLTIWMEDDIKEMSKAPKSCCDSQMEADFCNNGKCHYCVPERENQSRYVRGTILVPCRTAMKGSFPLNGTYFQVNEVFADHKSSHDPIHVAREQLWSLQRRMVYFGTSVSTIFKGLTTEEVQQCFWRGFVCVRGFDMETKAPRPLCPHLHLAASKLPRSRKTAETEQNSGLAKASIS
ncbi:uncharacterized protein LOC100844361 isoform X2 [Brachypodium distachyon]|nr:uncharacterized protein LOC100844361 isoform X2 [Brachypodium distachyon]XP_014754551.1 uncharacterized protein LOC100844361 isoform X2 [Brachypodium distachyon]XP_014754552.1 uncharacterized protein LOC100844361 isoform X2 [Brachypodium distachyon]PNT71154.1 hypothetical protein BRADI_2g23797v3 [Brachypodium distachyon]PNT71155.1 hypothetical protein BRADI_2g23797v3 [Brachypodium distachyon]|eukprot:XP_014754550.1 uncharacterized protein LOC100844361 isoform X2 [Brachypodium distachyon]